MSKKNLNAKILHGSIGSLIVRVGQVLLAFALSTLLARLLGPDGYGQYAYPLAIVTVLGTLARSGVSEFIIRETAKLKLYDEWTKIQEIWSRSDHMVFILSAILAFAFLIFASFIPWGNGLHLTILYSGILLIPLLALTAVRSACLKGLGYVVLGQIPDNIFRPLLMIMMVGGLILISNNGLPFSPGNAIFIYTLVSIATFLFAILLLRKKYEEHRIAQNVQSSLSRIPLRTIFPLAFVTCLEVMNSYTDILLLGVFCTDEDIGIYRVVSQTSGLVAFGYMAIDQALHPSFARIFAKGDICRLQRLVTVGAMGIVFFALVPYMAIFLYGEEILTLIYGKNYAKGDAVFLVLASGQLVNAGFGPALTLLNMSGHERDSLRGMLAAAMINIVGGVIFIPLYGIQGAAFVNAFSLISCNLLLRHYVMRRLSVESTVLGGIARIYRKLRINWGART